MTHTVTVEHLYRVDYYINGARWARKTVHVWATDEMQARMIAAREVNAAQVTTLRVERLGVH